MLLNRLSKKLAALIPGTGANIAAKKKLMERDLRGQGYSRTHAAAIVAKRFNKSPLQT